MIKQTGYIFQDEIRRVSGLNQSGNFKEQSSSGVTKVPSCPGHAETLARKSATEQLEVGHSAGIGFSGIFNEPLSLRVKQGIIAAIGILVNFAVTHTFKASGTGQTFAETADAGEHIYKSNHRFDNEKRGSLCWLPLRVKYVIFSIVHLPPFRCHLVRRSRHQRFPPQPARPQFFRSPFPLHPILFQ